MKTIFLFLAIATCFTACKKDAGITPPATPQSFSDFIKNTEWVGTLDRRGFQYRPPCSLKFNADNTFFMYSHFIFFPNNAETRRDSIGGTIMSIDSLPDGRTRITTNINTTFMPIATNYIYITDRKKLSGISADATQPPTFDLDIFPAAGVSVFGTHWHGPLWPRSLSPVPYAYPDLSNIHFQPDGINTVYTENNQPVLYSQNTQLQHIYKQIGARVYMSGYKYLPGGAAIPVNNYLGIFLPSGNEMMVDSYSFEARLPNYINTTEPYGPNGVTPIIYKY
jgi:hypothetical protein